MAKLICAYYGKMIKSIPMVERKTGWRETFIGKEGVIYIVETHERRFIDFQPFIDHMHTGFGNISITDKFIAITTKNTHYVFQRLQKNIEEIFSEEVLKTVQKEKEDRIRKLLGSYKEDDDDTSNLSNNTNPPLN